MSTIKIFTIGFTKKTAKDFFEKLKLNGIKHIIDIRLNNVSQLAGFTKKDDLKYFLRSILDAEYIHFPELAPTKEILDEYRKNKGDWHTYEKSFRELIEKRRIEDCLQKDIFDYGCLLCSEDTPKQCHRRLVAEYLKEKWADVEIIHII